MDAIADAPDLATFVGDRTYLAWPVDHDLRRIDVRYPTPVYPHSLAWRPDNPHPALATVRDHLAATPPGDGGLAAWTPGWAEPLTRTVLPPATRL